MSAKRILLKKPISASVASGNDRPCAFCLLRDEDEANYGKIYAIGDVQCHYFCALLSCCLIQKGKENEGLFGFLYNDIVAEIERSKKHRCSYCYKRGASLGCSVVACKKQFHLPCGRRNNAVSLFYGNYKSFCVDHAPKQKLPPHIMAPARLRKKAAQSKSLSAPNGANDIQEDDKGQPEETICTICYEEVPGYPSVETFWPPCCGRDAWFHRTCLTRMALAAGMHYLKCPLCNDKQTFYDAVVDQGYYVPDRDAAWELEQNAFAEIYERPAQCAADVCHCPDGREHDMDSGPWDIKMCIMCGTVGMHAQCTLEPNQRFLCADCKPLAPEDLETFTIVIEQEILREQARKAAANVRSGPVMPSRMSIGHTKQRTHTLPSTSRALQKKEALGMESSPETRSTASSRLTLNLKTPKRCKEQELGGNVLQSIENGNTINTPIKMLQQGLTEKFKNMEMTDRIKVEMENMTAKLREQLTKPRPKTAKTKIVKAFLEGYWDNVLKDKMTKSPVKMWMTPKKYIASPKKSHDSPKTHDVSPKKSHASPKTHNESPKKTHVSPKTTHDSPKKSNASPKTHCESPKKSHASPKTTHDSPQKYNASPKTHCESPKKFHASPKTTKKYNASPKTPYESPNKTLALLKTFESPKKLLVLPIPSYKSPKKSLASPKTSDETPEKTQTVLPDSNCSKIIFSSNTPTKDPNITQYKKPLRNRIIMHTEIVDDMVNHVRFEDVIDVNPSEETQSNFGETKNIEGRITSPIGKVLETVDENYEQQTKDIVKQLFLNDIESSLTTESKNTLVPVDTVLESIDSSLNTTKNDEVKEQISDPRKINKTHKSGNRDRKKIKKSSRSREFNKDLNDAIVTPRRKTRHSTPKSAPGKLSNETIHSNIDTVSDYLTSTPKSKKSIRNKKDLAESVNDGLICKILEICDDDENNFQKEARFVKKYTRAGKSQTPSKSEDSQSCYKNYQVPEDVESPNKTDQESYESPLAGFPSEDISENSLLILKGLVTPRKLKTVDIQKDSSLEISEENSAINIDMIKNETNSEFLNILETKPPVNINKCALKFSPGDKQKMTLQETKLDIDMDIFKNQYLNEVIKHDQSINVDNETEIKYADSEDAIEKTVLDFDIDTSYRKKAKKKSKRKIKTEDVISKKKLKKNTNQNIKIELNKSNDTDLEIFRSKNETETIDVTVETVDSKSKRQRKEKKKKRHDNIRLKIRLKITKSSKKSRKEKELDKKKQKKIIKSLESPSKLQQYILKYPAESSLSHKTICKPDKDIQVTPTKRTHDLETTTDSLVQTSIQSFFILQPKD